MKDYSNSLCIKCSNNICKTYGGRCRKYNIIKIFQKLFKYNK